MMTNNEKRRVRCVIIAMCVCSLCFVFQWGIHSWLKVENARFVSPVGEENTLIRLQNVHRVDAPVIFMGSSLTERLLAGKYSASVAIPGSSFVYVNKFLHSRYQYKPGTVYVLEINNFFKGSNDKLLKRTEKWDFDLFRDSSHFSFEAKPVNMLTSVIFYMLEHGKGHTDTVSEESMPLVDMSTVPDITEDQKKKWTYQIEGVADLRARGGRICLINHPCKVTSAEYERSFEEACILAKYLGLPVLNYNTRDWIERLEFTDSTHLNSRKKSTHVYKNTAAQNALRIAVP